MASGNVCWGIELGAGAIKAIKIERRGEELKVLDFAVVPHKRVLSTPDLDQNDAMRVALGTLVSQHDLTGARIAVSVPGHAAFARFAKLPPVDRKKIPDIVKFEAVQQIPFPIEQVEWDYQTFQSPDSPEVEVGIFAMTRERVMQQLAQWQDVGITPSYVNLSPVAAYNALAWDWQFTEKTPGTVILDIGTTSADLIVCEAGRVWMRTFQLGGHRFTQALVDTFKLTYLKAEKLKREAEQSKHARHVFQAMRPIFGDLAQEVQRSLQYYQQLHRDANLTRLIGLGSTFQLPGLRKYLAQQLQLEVVRPEGYNRITFDGPRAGELQAASLNLATAYGMALQGVGLETIEANLMPTSVVRAALWKRKRPWFAAAAAVTLVAGAAGFARYTYGKLAVVNKPIDPVVQRVQAQVGSLKRQWQQVEGENAITDARAANALQLLLHRDYMGFITRDVGELLATAQAAAVQRSQGQAPPMGGVRFVSFSALFEPPRRPMGDEGFGGSPMGGSGDDEGKRTLTARLIITTTLPDTGAFMQSTFVDWLLRNAERPGVPYTIRYERLALQSVAAIEGDDAADPMGISRPGAPGTGIAGDRGPGRTPGGMMGTGSGGRPSGFGSGGAGGVGGTGDLDQLAPMPAPPPNAPPGTNISTYELIWTITIKPPSENNEDDNNRLD